MLQALESNIAPTKESESLGSLAERISGGRARTETIERYLSSDWTRIEMMFLYGLGFVIMHEQCHVAHQHPRLREQYLLAGDRDVLISLEYEADSCVLEIVNRDEERLGGSPGAGYIGALTVLSTQMVFEALFQRRLGDDAFRTRTHPTPESRLRRLAEIVHLDLQRRDIRTPEVRNTVEALLNTFDNLQGRLNEIASGR